MQLKVLFLLFFVIISVNCHFIKHDTETRAKRSPEEGFFSKAKSGITQFGSDVKRVANKGYEEVKNLFSKDRKVGDYTLDNIDVRFSDDEDEENTTDVNKETTEEVNEIERAKRDVMDLEQEIKDAASNEFKSVTEAPPSKSTTLPNNAEVSPGYPRAEEIIHTPLICKKGHVLVNGNCHAEIV